MRGSKAVKKKKKKDGDSKMEESRKMVTKKTERSIT